MPALLRRAAGSVGASLPGRVARRYLAVRGSTWAQVIAWNTLFAIFPIVLVTVTVLGVFLHDPGIAAGVEARAVATVGGSPDDQHAIMAALEAFRSRTGQLAAVGFVGLLWGGSALIGALDEAINALYPCPPRTFIRQKLMSVGMILLFTLLTVPLVLSSSLLALLGDIPGVPGFLSSGPAALVLQASLGALDGAVLLSAIYYVVPHRRQRLLHTLPGALAGGVLLEVLTLLFPLYLTVSHGFATYGKTFALFFVMLTYVYFLGQIVMVGATVNAELARASEDPEHLGAVPLELGGPHAVHSGQL